MMKCPLCDAKMEYEESFSDDHNGFTEFPEMSMDYWCAKGHLVQAIACEETTGWQVLIIDGEGGGDELFAFWYDTKRRLKDVTDWKTGAYVWAP